MWATATVDEEKKRKEFHAALLNFYQAADAGGRGGGTAGIATDAPPRRLVLPLYKYEYVEGVESFYYLFRQRGTRLRTRLFSVSLAALVALASAPSHSE